MNTILWCAFDEAAHSDSRYQQVLTLSNWMQCVPTILTLSKYISYIQTDAFKSIACEDLSESIHHPARFASSLAEFLKTAPSQEIRAILAPAAPHWTQILSLFAAYAQIPFFASLSTAHLPAFTRIICAGRVLEELPVPQRCFAATLSLEQPSIPRQSTTSQTDSHAVTSPFSQLKLNAGEIGLPIPELTFESFPTNLIQLDTARVVFAGGRGLGSKQNFDRLAACAQKCRAGLAASRLAVDMGWCRNDLQVGQTGKTIAPDLYVTFGISGAIQHLAGIKSARKIMAINTDKDAPIFKYADYGLISDVSDVLSALETELASK